MGNNAPAASDLALYLPPPPAPETMAEWLYFKPDPSRLRQQLAQSQPMPMAGPSMPIQAPQPQPAPEPLPNPNLLGLNKNKPKDEGKKASESDAEKKSSESVSPADMAAVSGFDGPIIRNLNARLEDLDDFARVRAANDFVQIMMNSPAITKDPDYKPYTDAFALKILRDPMAPVHQPILLAIESGYYTTPSPEVMFELEKLRRGDGLLGLEAQNVEDALFALRLYQQQDAQNNSVPTKGQLRQQRQKNPAVSPIANLTPRHPRPRFIFPWERRKQQLLATSTPSTTPADALAGTAAPGLSTPPLSPGASELNSQPGQQLDLVSAQ